MPSKALVWKLNQNGVKWILPKCFGIVKCLLFFTEMKKTIIPIWWPKHLDIYTFAFLNILIKGVARAISGKQICFFPQHIVEGLLNSRRRVSDRPSWILTSKTPARKWKNIQDYFFVPHQGTKSCKEEILNETPYSSLSRNLKWNPILGTQIFLS